MMTLAERVMVAAVLESVRECSARVGLASLVEVRRAAAELDVEGEAFEWALLALAADRKVTLHFHDCPSAMGERERAAALVRGGTTYHAVAAR